MTSRLRDLLLPARTEALAALQGAFAASIEGSSRVVLVRGGPGSGRSALLEAFAKFASATRRTAVIQLRPPARGIYQPVTHAGLATSPALYRRFGGERQARATAGWLLPEWIGAIPGWGDLAGAVTATAEAWRRRRDTVVLPRAALQDEAIEALLLAARRTNLVVLIDDAERADAAEAYRLGALLDAAPAATRLLLVLACPAALNPDAPLHALYGRSDASAIDLDDLTEAQLELIVQARYPDAAERATLVRALDDATAGHAASVAAMLGQLEEQNAIERRDDGTHIDIAALAHIAPLALRHADAHADLDAETRRVLAHASRLGTRFAALQLAQELGLSELAVEDILSIAERRRVVRYVGEDTLPNGAPTSVFRFVNAAYMEMRS